MNEGFDPPRRLRPRVRHFIWPGAFLLFIVLLWILGGTLIPFLLAFVLALALDPAVEWLARSRWRRSWTSLGLTILVVAFVALGVTALLPVLATQAQEFIAQLPRILDNLRQIA